MRTSEPILTRGRDVWDGINLPPAEFRARAAKVREKMDQEDVHVLLLYGTGDRDGDIAYLSNLVHKVPGFPLALALTAETAIVLNQRSSRTRPIVERSTWIDDVRFTRDLWSTFEDILEEVADAGDTVGFVGADGMAVPEYESVEALGEQWTLEVRDDFLEDVRTTKSERERDQVRRSGAVLQALTAYLDEDATAPTREHDLEAALDRLARLHGAQDVRLLLANPAHSEGTHRPAEGFPIAGDDPISIYLAVRYEGYWSSVARTLTLGDDRENETIDAAEAAYETALGSLELGGHTDDLLAAVEAETGAFEVADQYDLLTGIGLELDETPTVTGPGDAGFEIQPGMCLEIALPLRTEDAGTALFGDTIVVTDEGVESVTR